MIMTTAWQQNSIAQWHVLEFLVSHKLLVVQVALPGQFSTQPLQQAETQDLQVSSPGRRCNTQYTVRKCVGFLFLANYFSSVLTFCLCCFFPLSSCPWSVDIPVLTDAFVSVAAGELNGSVVTAFGVLAVFLVFSVWVVAERQAVIYQVHLQTIQNKCKNVCSKKHTQHSARQMIKLNRHSL